MAQPLLNRRQNSANATPAILDCFWTDQKASKRGAILATLIACLILMAASLVMTVCGIVGAIVPGSLGIRIDKHNSILMVVLGIVSLSGFASAWACQLMPLHRWIRVLLHDNQHGTEQYQAAQQLLP